MARGDDQDVIIRGSLALLRLLTQGQRRNMVFAATLLLTGDWLRQRQNCTVKWPTSPLIDGWGDMLIGGGVAVLLALAFVAGRHALTRTRRG